jgi:hypothetical protein
MALDTEQLRQDYFNDSLPWQGVALDYMDGVKKYSTTQGLPGFDMAATFVSQASRNEQPYPYDACLLDLVRELVDFCADLYWCGANYSVLCCRSRSQLRWPTTTRPLT